MSGVSHAPGWWRTSDDQRNRSLRVPLLVVGSILCLVVGACHRHCPCAGRGEDSTPKLSALIPPSEQVTSVTSVRLTPTGPKEEIVKTSMSCQLGYLACGNLPPFYNGGGYPSRDLLLLAWNQVVGHWVIVFDAAKSTLFSTLIPNSESDLSARSRPPQSLPPKGPATSSPPRLSPLEQTHSWTWGSFTMTERRHPLPTGAHS